MKKFYAMGDTKGNPTLLKFSDKSWGFYKKWQSPDLLLYKYFDSIATTQRKRKYVPFFQLWRGGKLVKTITEKPKGAVKRSRLSLRSYAS